MIDLPSSGLNAGWPRPVSSTVGNPSNPRTLSRDKLCKTTTRPSLRGKETVQVLNPCAVG